MLKQQLPAKATKHLFLKLEDLDGVHFQERAQKHTIG